MMESVRYETGRNVASRIRTGKNKCLDMGVTWPMGKKDGLQLECSQVKFKGDTRSWDFTAFGFYPDYNKKSLESYIKINCVLQKFMSTRNLRK